MPDSKFSKFIRTASPEEKEKVMMEVARDATIAQLKSITKTMKTCPACKKKAFVVSIFGSICGECFYDPKEHSLEKLLDKSMKSPTFRKHYKKEMKKMEIKKKKIT